MLNPRSKQWQASAYKTFITFIIGTDLLAFIAYSDPSVADWFNHHINKAAATTAVWYYYYPILSFGALEGVVSAIFLVEYILRIATITERHRYGQHGPIQGRLLYATTTWSSWIDVCALAPYFIEQCTGLSLPTLTILRLFRLMRILKTAPYIRAMDAVYRVVYFNAEILYVALLVCFFLTLGTAVLLYLCRPPTDLNSADGRSDFSSIPATLYLSIALLTGQGGPRDEDDLPWYTKAIVVLTSLVSVVMFAIPASMLTWGWEAEAARMAKRARRRALEKQRVNREQGATATGNDADTSSSSSDGETTDEEYFRVIAGEGDGDESNTDDAKKSQWMQEVREAFVKADSDGTGTLSLAETASLLAATTTSTCDAVGENGAVAATPFHTVLNRLDRYEEDLRQTNQKLDLILHLLQKG
jgi:Ion transport protein